MISDRAKAILSERVGGDEKTVIFLEEGNESTIFRLFRAGEGAGDPEQQAIQWLGMAKGMCRYTGGEIRTGLIPSKDDEAVMAVVSGTDGLKPYIRYSLAGGYQTNGENALTYNECGLNDTWLQWNDEPTEMVTDAVEGWLESPGHRETMLSPEYRRVNLGLAWTRNVFKAIQHFEGDYVEMDRLPTIEDGVLDLEGNLSNSYTFTGTVPLVAAIVYDPRPRKLTGGQLARTYCYGHGELIAALIPPQRRLKDDFESTFSMEETQCIDPYHVRHSAAEPESQAESSRIFEESKEESLQVRETEKTLTFRKAQEMTADGREFVLVADVSELLEQHGAGVYTVVLLASLEGNGEDGRQVISEYSIFHGVRTPGGYGGER